MILKVIYGINEYFFDLIFTFYKQNWSLLSCSNFQMTAMLHVSHGQFSLSYIKDRKYRNNMDRKATKEYH